ncbi:WD40 repeat domain-containing serine/threonine protein kinase [Catenulispora pinisilvae]|uniref:WD40 repeat domain-containing serine/threonine protein kinase n=1 Tax=Catenulispora pinisilvae TaxID=2705253 RepID=UPI0018925193|nr:serine/threonine-protein kinase [Catenulispora pinisilvae]
MSNRVVGGRFRLTSVIGTGGFGRVWAAFDERLGVEVALKEVRLGSSVDRAERVHIVALAEHEARSAAKLRDHPNIVTVYDVVTDDEAPWLVMRLVRGHTLAEEIRVRGRLGPQAAARVAAGVLGALGAAHTAGIVHRDVKPANVMLADDGTVLLTDFGIAKQHTQSTQAVLMGTLHYMSPERLNGKDFPAGDLFALGVTLYEMTEGVSPFERATPTATVSAVALEQPDPPRHAGALAPLVVALLQKDPTRRPDAVAAQTMLAATGTRFTAASTVFSAPPADSPFIATPTIEPASTVMPTEVYEATYEPGRGAVQPLQSVPPVQPVHETAYGTGYGTGYGTDYETGYDTGETSSRRRIGRRGIIAAGLGVLGAAAVPVVLTLNSSGSSPSRSSSGGRWSGAQVLPNSAGTGPMAVAFNQSGTQVAGCGKDGVVRLWDSAAWGLTKTLAHRIVNPWSIPLAQATAFNPDFASALAVTFHPDGATLAVTNGDGTVSLWTIADGTETALPFINPMQWNGALGSVSFDPAGRILATTYDTPAVRLWDLSTRTSLATMATGDTSWVQQIVFSPAGGIVATASGNGNPNNTPADGRLQLWDPSSRTMIATLADTNSPRSQPLAFSPDGKTLANLRSDGRITLWDVGTRAVATILANAGSGVTCIAFGPGGVLAGGHDDGTVTLWDSKTSAVTDVLATGGNDPVNGVAVAPDGTAVVAAGKTITGWRRPR